ncbi:N-acetylmuramoyl-L-alanine amidase-like domain-containing protein [Geopsychrobacter electrodiphilus]|uniref:N-acetylmuramoyl-L-alanine amidase-like domain-containing protein n=1 Tax=Geopsychrobacter electrodiphilus TaxID=225196 RepID=UPI00035D8C35|nr:N-acetylmuramoyl-L-alanine amidase-like domain-containing protein [Geopsychrobacter electrodiphilus]
MLFKILIWILFFLGLNSGVALGADQNLINLGHWSNPDLAQIITTAGQIKAPGERIVALSSHFLGTPYVAHTLSGDPQTAEQLVINLAGFDCFTYLDVIEALRRSSDLDNFPDQLRQVRYRGGKVAYTNRRHFFSDWVVGSSARIHDVTTAVGQGRAQVVSKKLNRKSAGAYWLPGIPVTQRDIAYIPSDKIDRELLSALQSGDYVGIYTDNAGLDVSHVGLLVKDHDRFILRHASSRNSLRRVVDVDLLKYIQGKPGLVVYRAR